MQRTASRPASMLGTRTGLLVLVLAIGCSSSPSGGGAAGWGGAAGDASGGAGAGGTAGAAGTGGVAGSAGAGGSAGAAGAGAAAAQITDGDYAPDDDPTLKNPARGIYYWDAGRDDSQTLVAEWLYLGDECDQDLAWMGHGAAGTSAVLDAYADALSAHRDGGRKVIFRPRYDTPTTEGALNGCGVFQADTAARMRGHVDAVAAMLGDFVDVIGFVEAGYLGRWGEWNHSGHAASTAPVLVDQLERRAFLSYVVDAYLAAGADRFVEVRRPVFAREIVETDPGAKLGLYNDCFMTTDSDYGTYSNFDASNPYNFASSDNAKSWAMSFTATAPFGGETCPTGDNTERWRSCSAMVGSASEPASLHMSYLHGGYATDARATWEAGSCYDEIRRRLGYRFEVDAVTYPPEAAASGSVRISIAVSNTGWSRLHNPRRAYLVLRSDADAYVVGGPASGYVELSGSLDGSDVTHWEPGAQSTLSAVFDAPPPGNYSLRLWLPDANRPDVLAYAVTIASLRNGTNLRDPLTGENDLGVSVRVLP